MCSNHGRVDDTTVLIDLQLQCFEYFGPRTTMRPSVEAIVDRFPWAVAFREISPRTPSLRAIEIRVDERTISNNRIRASSFWQSLHEGIPLCVGQLMSVRHGNL